MSKLYARAFPNERGWSAQEITDILADPGVVSVFSAAGFAMLRVASDEAEVLSLAVDPDVRRQGNGRDLLQRGMIGARALGAERMFLEVSERNIAALSLYRGFGLRQIGVRKKYYRRTDGHHEDAIVMGCDLWLPQRNR